MKACFQWEFKEELTFPETEPTLKYKSLYLFSIFGECAGGVDK